MTAVFDTYCTSDRPEFSVFGNFVGRRDEQDSGDNVALVKSYAVDIYEVTREQKIRFITSSRLLQTPIACTSLKGVRGMPDYIVMLFSNWEIMLYRYSYEYGELELVSKDQIEIGDLTKGSSSRFSPNIISGDDYINMDQLEVGGRPNGDDLVLMITSPKFLLFITYKVKTDKSDLLPELSIGICWGILTETDIYMDTIVDSCQILDENSSLCLHPKIAILTRIGPISTGSVQSHSNCVSLIYLVINMELTEFTVLDKLELLPTDSYKLIPFDNRRSTNMCLSGGLLVISRNSIIVHGGLNRPFTLITTNDSYERVPEKKLEIDICTQKVNSFKPKTFGFETGAVVLDGGSASTTFNDTSESFHTSLTEASAREMDLRILLSNLQPILINEPELSIEFEITYSVPFLITNEYYGILLFNRVQPYFVGLVVSLSTNHPNGIKGLHWFKVNEYWDWSRAYLPSNEAILNLETTTLSKRLGTDTVLLDEHYLITSIPVFKVQNVHPILNRNDDGLSTGSKISLVLVAGTDSNSGISILDFIFNEMKTVPSQLLSSGPQDPEDTQSTPLSYDSIVNLVKSKEENSRKIKKIQADSFGFPHFRLEDLERFYLYSDAAPHSRDSFLLRDVKVKDYLDLGPNSLRDFCIIPSGSRIYSSCDEELEDEKSQNRYRQAGGDHAILGTNGAYPIGQLSLYEKSMFKSAITKFSLDDILFHWTLNDPITNKTKYLVFTSDPLKSIGKTYFFSLDTCCDNDLSSQEVVTIGDVNQLDPSDGEFDYEADSNTVGAGVVKMGESYSDVFVIQTLPSTISILNFEISARLAELDLISTLFSDHPDAPMAIKSFVLGSYIPILFEDSTIQILKVTKSRRDLNQQNIENTGTEYNHNRCLSKSAVIAEFSSHQIVVESLDDLFEELDRLCEINQIVIRQRVIEEGDTPQLFEEVPTPYVGRRQPFSNEEKSPHYARARKHRFWIRHISPVILNSDRGLKSPEDFLVVMVIYSKLWLNGSLAIYNLERRRLVFFSPFVSAVPCLMGNVLSQTGSREEIIYRFLENEFDLGRPVTSVCTPMIEPRYYMAREGGEICIPPTLPLGESKTAPPAGAESSTSTHHQSTSLSDQNPSQGSSSFLISCELIKMDEEDSRGGSRREMILVASVSQKPILIYRLDTRSRKCSTGDLLFSNKWKLEIQTNFDRVQADISKFFALFPKSLTGSNIQETFSNESPLSIYNCGHGVSFNSRISNAVDAWIIQPPSAINTETGSDSVMSDEDYRLDRLNGIPANPSSLVVMTDRARLSVVGLGEAGVSSCIAKIDSPWSPLHILLTTSTDNEIAFEFLNLAAPSSDPRLLNSLSPLPFPGSDNWLLRRAFLPEVVIQRVAFCAQYKLVAVIVGIPDNAKHHLNGYHIRQMAFYRYLRCLEAGGKEAQTILLNQDLIRNPEKCFEKSLNSIPDLGIPPASYASETYFDTLPPGIEIGEATPKIFHQSNAMNEKARKIVSASESASTCNGFEREQFGALRDLNILRNELLIYSFEDLFPSSRFSGPSQGPELESFPKPRGRYAFGAWEVGLSIKFGQDPKGQQVLIVGTGTNPTQYYEAEGRLLMFRVKQLAFLSEESGHVAGKSTADPVVAAPNIDPDPDTIGVGSNEEIANDGSENETRGNNLKWTNMLKYWPSRFAKQLYHENVQELELCFQSMYRGPVTCVDLISLPATTAQIAPAIPALAAYPIIQNNSIVRAPNSKVTYIAHTLGYRLYVHELRENSEGSFVKGSFMDTPLGISSISNYKALFFLGDIRRGVHFGMLRTDASRGSQSMVKLARSHPLWKFTCTSAQAIVQDKDLAILVSDNSNNIFTFEPNFNATQIIDKETLKPTSHTSLCTSLVHMRGVDSGNGRYVIASGRNGSFFSIRLANKLQYEHLSRTEKLLCCNIPSFLGISPGTLPQTHQGQTAIPSFIQNLYPTDKIIFLKHLKYLKYLSNPILQSIFKNSDISLPHILQFIV